MFQSISPRKLKQAECKASSSLLWLVPLDVDVCVTSLYVLIVVETKRSILSTLFWAAVSKIKARFQSATAWEPFWITDMLLSYLVVSGMYCAAVTLSWYRTSRSFWWLVRVNAKSYFRLVSRWRLGFMPCQHFSGQSLRVPSTTLSHDGLEQIIETRLQAHFKTPHYLRLWPTLSLSRLPSLNERPETFPLSLLQLFSNLLSQQEECFKFFSHLVPV